MEDALRWDPDPYLSVFAWCGCLIEFLVGDISDSSYDFRACSYTKISTGPYPIVVLFFAYRPCFPRCTSATAINLLISHRNAGLRTRRPFTLALFLTATIDFLCCPIERRGICGIFRLVAAFHHQATVAKRPSWVFTFISTLILQACVGTLRLQWCSFYIPLSWGCYLSPLPPILNLWSGPRFRIGKPKK